MIYLARSLSLQSDTVPQHRQAGTNQGVNILALKCQFGFFSKGLSVFGSQRTYYIY